MGKGKGSEAYFGKDFHFNFNSTKTDYVRFCKAKDRRCTTSQMGQGPAAEETWRIKDSGAVLDFKYEEGRLSAIILKNIDECKTRILECERCGWKGTFDDGSIELYELVMDSSCPQCHADPTFHDYPQILAVIRYPSLEEARASSDPDTRKMAEVMGAYQAIHEREKLKHPEQLPDVPASRFTLAWDFMQDPVSKDWRTVICYKDSVLFSEPAVYEGFDRFAEVARILKDRYGTRLRDLVPTGASGTYLYGDTYRSFSVVEGVRAELFGTKRD